jgi:hypothetical protein
MDDLIPDARDDGEPPSCAETLESFERRIGTESDYGPVNVTRWPSETDVPPSGFVKAHCT